MYFDDTEIDEKLTTIQKFYYGTNIFVTGATGFLGKILLNKLFTSCPGIETVYVLVRKKKNKDVHTRVEEIFEDPIPLQVKTQSNKGVSLEIFNLMKKVNPKFRHHIKSISGDCMLPGLGISNEDRQSLIENVNIVFHMAATVRFDEKLKVAMQINVKAPRDIMLLCKEMHNLKSILHVSTAYTQCPLRRIDEKFYPPPSDSNNLILLTECTPDNLLENMTPMLLGKYPNTYTFTKAVAEDVVKQCGKHLPVGIFRPGIVISTYRDPVCGWIDNFYGPTGAIAGAGTGIIRTLRCDPRAVANMVPVDLCVNSIIAASWEISEKQKTIELSKEIPVYNFCTSKKNQLTWGDFTTKTTKYGLMYPTLKAMWYLCYANTPNKLMHMLSIFILHYVPATIFDAICMLLGKKPRLLNTYKKIHRFMHVIEYFAMRQWDFQIDNVRGLWQQLSVRDKDLFYFNMEKLDWDLFLQQYFRGIRQYLLQDPLDTIPQALVRWNRGPSIMDIEDLVKVGQKLKMCPYYSSKELVEDADIVFMPYNYLLDPAARKANKIELSNAICILDEAHNIEKICEESASVQIKSSDVAMAIEDTTHIMSSGEMQDSGDEPKDFTIDDLALLKDMLLELEKVIDDILVENKQEGATFPASFIFDLLGKAGINYSSSKAIVALLDKLVQYMAVASQNNHLRKGGSFQKLADLLIIVFINKEDTIQKVYRSFKVHVQIEEPKQQYTKGGGGGNNDGGWLSKGNTTMAKAAKIINYWCFNPGFGMEQLLNTNVRSVILTSGTLAPLKPLIAKLAIPVAQRLENPHIVQSSQVFVKIIGSGPDREQLISNYQNRDNPKYISSLGSTILNVARIVPDGLLVFFPSYPMLNQCVNSWQASGLWADISRYKPVYIEPRSKEDFTNTMEAFYKSIKDSKGACFMAVCRGKVSEGLDFADRNGRAVIRTGLPFPPLKDPKVILKRKYLEDNRTKENELLTGQAWYALDATRAVNQAIGRVIRHRNDYGAILLCDMRFQQASQVQQLSKWIRDILGSSPKSLAFGPVVKELRDFFKNAEKSMPAPKERSVEALVSETCEQAGSEVVRSKYFSDPKEVLAAKTKFQYIHNQAIKIEKTNSIESWTPSDYASAAGRSHNGKLPSVMDFMSRLDSDVSSIDFNSTSSSSSSSLVQIHKHERSPLSQSPSTSMSSTRTEFSKKKKYKLIENNSLSSKLSTETSLASTLSTTTLNSFAFNNKPQLRSIDDQKAPEERVEFLKVLRSVLSPEDFSSFTAALITYKRNDSIAALLDLLFKLLGKPNLLYMLRGMRRFLKNEHRSIFDERLAFLT